MNNDQPHPVPTLPTVRDERILLALPAFDRIDVPFVMSYSDLLASTRIIGLVDWLPGDSLVNRARNNLAHRFMQGYPQPDDNGKTQVVQYDWMLFMDTDLIFRGDSVVKIYELARERGPGIYCGTYPMKMLKPKIVCNTMPGATIQPDGTVEVREAGTGFMLIHRQVFEKMQEKFYDEMRYAVDMGDDKNPQKFMFDYFTVGVRYDPLMKTKRFLSEDWYFCQRWRECGGKIIMQTKISCAHIGKFAYPGNPNEILEAAEIIKKSMATAAPKEEGVAVKVAGTIEEKIVAFEKPTGT